MMFILKLICYAGIGMVLGYLGHTFLTWEYWVIMLLVVGVQITEYLDDK